MESSHKPLTQLFLLLTSYVTVVHVSKPTLAHLGPWVFNRLTFQMSLGRPREAEYLAQGHVALWYIKWSTWKAYWMPGLSPVPIPESLDRAWPPPSLLFSGPGRLDPSICVPLPCRIGCVSQHGAIRERDRERERPRRALCKEQRLIEQGQTAAILSRLPVCAYRWAHSRCSIKDLWNKHMNEWMNEI